MRLHCSWSSQAGCCAPLDPLVVLKSNLAMSIVNARALREGLEDDRLEQSYNNDEALERRLGVIGCLCNDNFRKGRGDLSWHISAHMSWGKVRLEGNHKYFKTDAHFS